ncbi:hypothetical protein BLNAU_21599 [Blattamonas nauphoetae]|uniref:Uncharacterized protein n=1 Tax=Blattamonas nauphoetae TaxID=2049346 RepID=A0ABQ9WVH0_9EUKA|nr:hypothetical protein BLNAU_21599 [Blattamonas nauphoetae]
MGMACPQVDSDINSNHHNACDGSDIVHSALSEEIETESLASCLGRLVRSDGRVSWTLLMEWFVEAVIGAEILRNEHPSAPPLTNENIRIDILSTVLLSFPSSPQQPSKAGSLSSDISMLCQFFLHTHRTLEQQHRLILPLDPKHEDIVFARIMVALVEHFVASGDLILPNSSPTDHSPYFSEWFRNIRFMDNLLSNPFLLHNLASSFTRFVLHPNNRNIFVPAAHSFLCGDAVESSEQLLDAVKKAKETHSMETVRNAFYDWTEWVTMMKTIEKDAAQRSDLSFLQSRCLRSTLLSLQTKHQLRANPTPIEENRFADSCHFTTTTDALLLSSTIATQTDLQSQQSPSTAQHLSSEQFLFHPNPVVRHSRQVLLATHYLLTRPPPDSFSWNTRPSIESESELDADFQLDSLSVDLHEKFHTSLFDETDDTKLVAALRRCHAVVEATKSTKCISDVHTFRSLLLAGLHSPHTIVQFECFDLFFELEDYIPTVNDPRDVRFACLRMAFQEGTFWEKMTLLWLWERWLNFGAKNGDRKDMNESDFDFSGLLATDLSDVQLFVRACQFVGTVFLTQAMSMSFRWKMDFLHQFEKRNRMLSRIASDPRMFSKQYTSHHCLTPHATMLGSFLSVYRSCDFPPALTEVITSDSDTYPQHLITIVNPAFFLNHTTIAPKHRHSFFPMDLMFERYLRSDPVVFLKVWSDVSECTSRKFLFTPYVGLHSLLLRCPKLNLDQEAALRNLVAMLFIQHSNQESTQSEINALFCHFPPPRLIDTLISSPHLSAAPTTIRVYLLEIFNSFGVYLSPFGACFSLVKVFRMLYPSNMNENPDEPQILCQVGDVVVSLHWFNIPSHFDSPLLCHLPSLAGAQRGVLQTLSSRSGIPSLISPYNLQPDWNRIRVVLKKRLSPSEGIYILTQCVRYLESDHFLSSPIGRALLECITATLLLSPHPAVMSAAFEFFHRFVSVSSDAVRMDLVRKSLLDSVVFAVSCSSFLDDYEKGVAVIGILLDTIRRDHHQLRTRTFDFRYARPELLFGRAFPSPNRFCSSMAVVWQSALLCSEFVKTYHPSIVG